MVGTVEQIRVEAMIADSVQVAGGKLYVQGGGWNRLNARSFPARHPRVGLGMLIHVPWTETDQQHELRVRLLDEDGQPVPVRPSGSEGTDVAVSARFNVGRPSGLVPGDEQVVPLAINLDGLIFPRPGAYVFVVEIEGEEVHRVRFRSNETTAPQA